MCPERALWVSNSPWDLGDLSVLHTVAEDRDGLLKPEYKSSPGRPDSIPL